MEDDNKPIIDLEAIEVIKNMSSAELTELLAKLRERQKKQQEIKNANPLAWQNLTQEQRNAVIDYDVNRLLGNQTQRRNRLGYIRDLKAGEDAIFLRYQDLIDWWDNLDEEYQREVLRSDEQQPDQPTTGS